MPNDVMHTRPSRQAAVPDQALQQQAGVEQGQGQQVVGGMMALVGQIDQAGQSPGEKWQMLKAALTELTQQGQQQPQQRQPVDFSGANPTVR